MKLIYMEPVLEEIEKQQEYFEQAEDFDCAEAVMSAKWAVINANEVEAIPIEWLKEHDNEDIRDSDGNSYGRRKITVVEALSMWKKEQEVET